MVAAVVVLGRERVVAEPVAVVVPYDTVVAADGDSVAMTGESIAAAAAST